jgi:transporter family protein
MLFQCIIVLLIFGLTPLLNKHTLKHISVEGFMFFASFITFIFIFVFFSFFFHQKITSDLVTFSNKPYLYGYISISTILVFVVADYFYLNVLRDHSPSIVVPIIATYPLITILYTYLFTKEHLRAIHIIGSGLIVSGLVLLNQ